MIREIDKQYMAELNKLADELKQNNNVETGILTQREKDILGRVKC